MLEKDFFTLLRAGLNQHSNEELTSDPDWDYIYTLSTQQTVQGIIADGISVMNLQGNLPDAILKKFQDDTVTIIRRNAEINALQSQICQILTDHKIKHYIVKGQKAARNYPNPHLRSAGDIDILFPPEDYEKAKLILQNIADSYDPELPTELHKGYFIGDIEVEIHGTLHPNIGKRINTVIDELQCSLFNGSITLETFNALYLFLHSMQHYYGYGLGLRQVIDWHLHLERQSLQIDNQFVTAKLSEMHLTKDWNTFLSFAHDVTSSVQLSPSSLLIWKDCESRGNMGHYRKVEQRKGNFVRRNATTLHSIISRYSERRNLMPTLELQMLTKNIAFLFNLAWSRGLSKAKAHNTN